MKHLPTLNADASTPEWQAERLARWLTEWLIERALAEADVDDTRDFTEANVSPESLVASYDPDVRQGQIRLFAGHATARPIYFAVLRQSEDRRFLCAPFGRFAEPALPAEWITGRDVPLLQVLCVWNGALLPQSVLTESWVVDMLTDHEQSRALMVDAYFRRGEPMPPDLERQTGPPMIHPADPRREYLEIEAQMMEPLLRHADSTDTERESRPLGSVWYTRE